MPVDLDAPARAALAAFGDTVQNGGPVTYTPQGGQAFPLDVLYDESWASLTITASRHGGVVPVSTTKPCLGARLPDFPTGVLPQQGDALVRANGEAYEVADVNPDGFGWVYLKLNRTN